MNNDNIYEIKDIIYNKELKSTNVTFMNKELNKKKLEIGSHLAYEGAFGLTKKRISNINPNLKKYTPYHHVLYIGNGVILQYTGGVNNISFTGIRDSLRNAEVVKDSIENFKNLAKKKGKLFLIEHDNIDKQEIILKRCDEVIGEKKYSFFNNCEDIVNYCLTGQKKSKQRETFINDIGKTFIDILKNLTKK